MKKVDYYQYAVQTDLYLKRAWLLSCFGILPDGTTNEFFIVNNGKMEAVITKDGQPALEVIEDFKLGQPLFGKDEKVDVKNNYCGFIEGDITTTYGLLITNCLMLWYPYKGKAKYINGIITDSMLNSIAYDLLKSGQVGVDAHIRFENAGSMYACLSQCGVASATRKALLPNPETIKLKKRLLEENRDRLDDPAVVADIQAQLIQSEREWLKGDPAAGFYIKDKTMKVSRLKTMGMYGAEPDFYDESKIDVMTASLSDGWNKENMPMLINSLRGGSYARGKETALGGESTKITSRIFQNYRIDVDDCGTTLGLTVTLNPINYMKFVGRYQVGSTKPLTIEELERLSKEKKTIQLRSPAYCKTLATSFCKRCMGDAVSNSGLGLNSQAIIATSTFMSINMSLMHGRELKTEKYSYKDRIS